MSEENKSDMFSSCVVPHAVGKGSQEGRISAANRKYGTAYKVVSLGEAVSNMVARKKGELPIIRGGLDDNSEDNIRQPGVKHEKPSEDVLDTPEEQSDDISEFIPESSAEEPDDFADTGSHEEPVSVQSVPVNEIAGMIRGVIKLVSELRSEFKKSKETSQRTEELKPDKSVMMTIRQEHSDGTFTNVMQVSMPVSDIIVNSTSITLVYPVKTDSPVFYPAAGSDILLDGPGLDNVHVFYPGTCFSIGRIGISAICFIKAN